MTRGGSGTVQEMGWDALLLEGRRGGLWLSRERHGPGSWGLGREGRGGGRGHSGWGDSSAQPLSCVQLSATPCTAARQASLSITSSLSPPTPMSIGSVMPSNHLVLCRSLLLPPSIFPSIRVFSIESALRIRWPEYWSFSFSISPSNEHPGLVSSRMDWVDLPGWGDRQLRKVPGFLGRVAETEKPPKGGPF